MAEGLIPFVYRAIKRRKGLRRYHTMSTQSAAAGAAAAAIVAAGRGIPEDHAVDVVDYRHHHQQQWPTAGGARWAPTTLELGGGNKDGAGNQHHRRWATVDDFDYEVDYRRQQQPPLAKARSSRVFSCITGM